MQDPLPRGTVTFLFTDIEGSTRLSEGREEVWRLVRSRYFAILDEAAIAQKGFVFDKSGGDSARIAFHSPSDALNAAVAAQKKLFAEPWLLGEPLRVRMALHTCEAAPEWDGNSWDYLTPKLNRLGRLLPAGHGGQILLTSASYGLLSDTVFGDVTIRDLGEHRLRDLAAEHIYQAIHPDLPDQFPPLNTAARFTHNLPYLPTSLVGRERETAEIRGLLLRDDVRLVTLTGPGGTGKTRLAIHVAAGLLEDFADGVFLVDLAALADPDLVPSVVARTLGVREEPERPVIESIVEWLRNRRVLLVLDTFEQVIAAASVVAELLGTCPRLKILIASRAALSIQGEQNYPVPSLAVPDALAPPEAIFTAESVQLFVERARNLQPAFIASATIAPSLAKICARLDGLPLAIELAAARIKLFPPQVLSEKLERRLSLLTGGARDLPSRQRTLRATIAWSYDLLPQPEQVLFRHLSVFAGGFSYEAAEAVCGRQGSRVGGQGAEGVS
ncbi:MAG TPA: NB-ARC domain-containing protein, partial [Thermomicrobiales bacterium]